MSQLGIWQSVLVNKSSRPVLTEGEHNICVKDGVGLYQGRLKIVNHQNGRVYLTNKRIVYIDSANQQRAIAINLKDASKAEFVERFLRSSPKVKVYLKTDDNCPANAAENAQSPQQSLLSLVLDRIVDWTCVICSFNNHLSTKTDLNTNFPKCVSCGIPPSHSQIEAALQQETETADPGPSDAPPVLPDQCPKCTFINHPSMRYCELCGTLLPRISAQLSKKIEQTESLQSLRSTNSLGLVLEDAEEYANGKPYVKFSFRKSGELDFYEHVVEEIDKMKWESLENRGMVSDDGTKLVPVRETTPRMTGGILGLEKIGEFQRKQNERLLSLSLEDLEQLMYKAQDLIQLTSSFGSLIKKKANLEARATIPPLVINKNSSLYHQELARHMSEYLLGCELTNVTSMITLQDLFAAYNRFRISSQGFGTELVTTQDFKKGLDLFDKLQLPVKATAFQSGLTVVVQRHHEPQKLHQVIMEYLVAEENDFLLNKFRCELLADTDGYMRDKYRSFPGKTATEIADHFGWSPAICLEEMDGCMDEQLVVMDKHILGTFFHVNKFDAALAARISDEADMKQRAHQDVIRQQQSISANLRSQHAASQRLLTVDEFDFGIDNFPKDPYLAAIPTAVASGQSLGDLAGLHLD